MKKLHVVAPLAAMSLMFSIPSLAAPVCWTSGTGANNHCYEFVAGDASTSWGDANTAATTAGGYLATITSAEEQAFINGSVLPVGQNFVWIGGVQDDSQSTPSTGWNWVTGETWSYTNWLSGEPMDLDNIENNEENHLQILLGQWIDNAASNEFTTGYIVETVPIPGAVWLFGSGLLGLVGMARRKKA